MRADAACEHRIPVHQQVVRGDGGGDVGRGRGHVLHRLARGDVLEHQPQAGKALRDLRQHRVDERLFPVEHIHLRVGDLAVEQQGQARFFHDLQHSEAVLEARHAGIGIGGGTGRVILDRMHPAARLRQRDLTRRGVVGEIECHQRLEARICGQHRQNAPAVGLGQLHGGHRRPQVGHDDGARELARRVRQHGGERGTVAQVQVPVVGAGEREGLHGSRDYTRREPLARRSSRNAENATFALQRRARRAHVHTTRSCARR